MPIALTVVTPDGQAFDQAVESVRLPGVEGEFGVLSGHEVFLTALQPGMVTIDLGGETQIAAVSKGFAEVHGDSVTVMVGSCEFAHQIDRERAEIARERIKKQLDEMRGTPDGEAIYEELQESYSRAITRLAVTDKFKN